MSQRGQQRGRSARTRAQRLARRRADSRGFDRGGVRRSRLFSRPVIGIVGLVLAVTLIASLAVVAFNSNTGPAPTADPPPVRRTGSEVDIGAVAGKPSWDEPPAFVLTDGTDYRAEIELEDGIIVELDLYEELAPAHVNNFVFLAREGFFDGLTFHRVIPGFVAQGGDPTATGTGGAGYTLPDEPINDGNEGALSLAAEGIISMARGSQGASSSQFFVTYTPQGQLDDQGFTAFGIVVSGMEFLHAFGARDPGAIPAPPAGPRIVAIRITEVGAQTSTE